jgi:CRISPR-associated protein Cmr4
MSEQHVLLFQALSSLHAGSGRSGVILHNPLRRHPDSHWPQISATTLQGALRKTLRDQLYPSYAQETDWKAHANQDPLLLQFFGQKTQVGSAGLHFSDTQLLALPLRSARGIWCLATSPALLRAFATHVNHPLPEIPTLSEAQLYGPAQNPLTLEAERLVLEDIEFSRCGEWSEGWSWLAQVLGPDLPDLNRLVLISDHCLSLFAQTRTEIFTFASDRKQPQQVEFMHPESLFYAVVQASAQASPDTLTRFVEQCPEWVQLGAYQSLGKGLCALRVLNPQGVTH